MPEWMVRLAGPERDLRFLLDRLQGRDWRVVEDGGKFYLHSRCFEGLAGAGEVKRLADERIELANLAGLLGLQRYRGVHTGEVVRVDPDGSRHISVSASGAVAAVGFASAVGSQPVPPLDLSRVMAVVQQQPAMAAALSYVLNEPKWSGYYKAYEAIRRANGRDRGLKRKGWVIEKAINRFTYSAQPDRHHDCPGPDQRMSEAEGRAFVLDLLRRWGDEELSGSP